jgi:hypothetical protein
LEESYGQSIELGQLHDINNSVMMKRELNEKISILRDVYIYDIQPVIPLDCDEGHKLRSMSETLPIGVDDK